MSKKKLQSEPETQIVDFNDIEHQGTTPQKREPKNAFLKSLKIKAHHILKEREPHDFLIEMPEDYQAQILRRDLTKEGKEHLENNYNLSMGFTDTMELYETEYKYVWNPELSHQWFHDHPNHQLNEIKLNQRRANFQRFIARLKEKNGFKSSPSGQIDQTSNTVYPLDFVNISDGPNSHGNHLKKMLLSELQNNRGCKLTGHPLEVYEHTLERFLGMCFSYSKFIFPMSRDSLELRSRRQKGQNA